MIKACNCIYIYNKIPVYSVNRKVNSYTDLNLILINICSVEMISNCLV